MKAKYNGILFERAGLAGVRIQTPKGHVIYIDPWSKMLDGEPNDADLVFCTHDDHDHYDVVAINAVSKDNTKIVAYEKINTDELNLETIPLGSNGELDVNGIHVRSAPAYNRSDGPHVRPSGDPYHPRGTVIGIILTIEDNKIYFCSDTDALEELGEIQADVVIPPIGGRPTMDRHEAADLMKRIDPDLVLPVHYTSSDLVDDLNADAGAFKEEVEEQGSRVVLI